MLLYHWLEYKTPDVVYASAIGGGALIIDKFAKCPKTENQKTLCAKIVV